MLKPINSTDEFFERLTAEGKVKDLNKPSHIQAMNKMNEGIYEDKTLYNSMNAGSIKSARDFYLTK